MTKTYTITTQLGSLTTPIAKEAIKLALRNRTNHILITYENGVKMKTTIKIYDRMASDIPYDSSMYIVDTHDAYTVFINVYNYTFAKKFKTKEEALYYYINK